MEIEKEYNEIAKIKENFDIAYKKRLDELQKKEKKLPEFEKKQLPEDIVFSLPKVNYFLWFWLPLSIFLLDIIYFIVLFLIIKKYTVITILFLLFSIFTIVPSLLLIVARIFLDRQLIKNKGILILYKNYIIANFLTSTKGIIEKVFPINNDGISFSDGNKDYIIDKEEIWYDSKKRPHCFYIPELPNPIKFNFKKTIEDYYKKLKDINTLKELDNYNNETLENDIAFSSINLQLFKKDKIFADLNRQEGTIDSKTFTTVLGIIGGITFLLLIALIISLVM